MIKPEQIPDEVVEAAAIERWGINEPTQWELETARIIIAAALAAWPGAYDNGKRKGWRHFTPALILPLPPETPKTGLHWSDCAVHNEPAFPVGPCNCDGNAPRGDE